jgi:hypothetical protein
VIQVNDEPKFKISMLLGHAKCNSWFEPRGNKLVGMGSITHYDKDGALVSHKVEPTGVEVLF